GVDEAFSRDDVSALIGAFRTVDVDNATAVKFETLPVEVYAPDRNRVIASPEADAVVERLRTFGDNAPKAATVQPSQVKVEVVDASGTNGGQSVVSNLVHEGFRATAAGTSSATVSVTEIRYHADQLEAAKTLLAYFPDAKLVPDPKSPAAVRLVLGTS